MDSLKGDFYHTLGFVLDMEDVHRFFWNDLVLNIPVTNALRGLVLAALLFCVFALNLDIFDKIGINPEPPLNCIRAIIAIEVQIVVGARADLEAPFVLSLNGAIAFDVDVVLAEDVDHHIVVEAVVTSKVRDGDLVPNWLPVELKVDAEQMKELIDCHAFVSR